MSIVFSRSKEVLKSRTFEYTTVSNIRNNAGISSSSLPDSDAIRLIRIASKFINSMTGQWFSPVHLISAFTGRGSRVLSLNGCAPLISLKSVEVVSNRSAGISDVIDFTNSVAMTAGAFDENYISIAPSGRYIYNLAAKWPVGASNILVDGWYAWLEEPKYITTVLASGSSVSSGTTSTIVSNSIPGVSSTFGVEVYDTIDPSLGYDNAFRERDVVVFLNSSGRELARRILTSVNYSTHTLSFDALPSNPISAIGSGTTVVSYGAIPEEIEYCCDELVKDFNDSSRGIGRQMKSEKTDSYQYTKFSLVEGSSLILSEVSANPVVANMLSNFVVPSYVSA